MSDLGAFLKTARTEVARYGDDDDVFVRELVQNARDAFARSISFSRVEQGEHELVCVDDDGSGMSRATVTSGLLRLFSSHKAQETGAAGCFGVGFWSVLRFADVDVVVETHDGQRPCALRIDLVNERLIEEPSSRKTRGTRVLLRRRRRDTPFALRAAILRHACHVTGNQGPPPRLELAGEVLNRPLRPGDDELSSVLASQAIEGDGFRGYVCLSTQPHIELLHHGLRVVQASSLLALVPSKKRQEPRGLGLSARIDVDTLSVLVDRKTVVEDDRLRAVVDACDVAAHRLEREALDDGAPLPLIDALWSGARRVLGSTLLKLLMMGFVTTLIGASVGFAGLWMLRPDLRSRIPIPFALPGVTTTATTTTTTTPGLARSVDDAARRFESPRIDVRGADPGGWDVDVDGVGTAQLRLFTLSVPDEARGLVARPRRLRPATAPIGSVAARIALRVDAGGPLILPSSSTLAPAWVSGARGRTPVDLRDDDGNPVYIAIVPGVLHVELARVTGPGPATSAPSSTSLSPALDALVESTRGLDREARLDALVALVQRRIAYAADPTSARLFDDDRRPFVERALGLQRGDCDVINTVLVRALLAAGYEARLAVGLVVVDDVVADDLHAWAEVRVYDGAPWLTLDASPPEARPRPVPAASAEPVPAVPATTPTTPIATSTSTSTPATTAPRDDPKAVIIGAGLLVLVTGAGIGALLLRRQRRRRPRADLLPLFVAGLHSGAAERLGLRRRPFVPTLDGALLSLDDAAALFARGRLARGAQIPAWLHKSVCVLDDDDPRVRALRPFLPPAVQLSTLALAGADQLVVDPRLQTLQARVDESFAGVRLRTATVDALIEVHLRTTDGGTHLVLIPPALLERRDLFDVVVAHASCLRGLR